jgi:hypothetical protein
MPRALEGSREFLFVAGNTWDFVADVEVPG